MMKMMTTISLLVPCVVFVLDADIDVDARAVAFRRMINFSKRNLLVFLHLHDHYYGCHRPQQLRLFHYF